MNRMAVCNSCGTQNMPSAKFCQECGKPREESPGRGATISADSSVVGKTGPFEGKASRPAVPAGPVAIDGYSKFVIGGCLFSGLVSIAAIVQSASFKTTIAAFSRTRDYTSAFENAADSFDGMTAASGIASFLLGIIFLVWIYRSYKMLRQFYPPGDIRFTPGWAVGWFFIPIASLFKPYQVMRELFNKSQTADETQRFRHGKTATAWWWGLTLVSFAASRITGKIADEVESTKSQNVLVKLKNYADARMFDEVVYLALLVATGFIVYKVACMLAIKSREAA